MAPDDVHDDGGGGRRTELGLEAAWPDRDLERGSVAERNGEADWLAKGDVTRSWMMDEYAEGVLCRRCSAGELTIIVELERCSLERSSLLRELDSGTGREEERDGDTVDDGSVPNDVHVVLLIRSVGARSDSLLLRASALSSSSSPSMGGDMIPGEVHSLSASSDAPPLRDQRELESSHTELESSVSVKSETTESVGLGGEEAASSSSHSAGFSLCSCSSCPEVLALL